MPPSPQTSVRPISLVASKKQSLSAIVVLFAVSLMGSTAWSQTLGNQETGGTVRQDSRKTQQAAWTPSRWIDDESAARQGQLAERRITETRVRWPEPIRTQARSSVQSGQRAGHSTRHPEHPVRQAQHIAPEHFAADSVVMMPGQFSQGQFTQNQVPHRVLQPPGTPAPSGGLGVGKLGGAMNPWSNSSNDSRPPKYPLSHGYSPHQIYTRHRPMQPPTATIPRATQRQTWKQPYSYGYFGASGTRHWDEHHGYRDRSTEWRLW